MPDPIKQEDGSFLNEAGAIVNEAGVLLDDDGKTINEEGFLINELGQLLNDEGQAVNATGELVDKDGKVIEDPADDKMIPKHRYDSASKRAKTAERELEKTKAQLAEVNANTDTSGGDPKTVEDFEGKINELDASIEEARKDGDANEVVRLTQEQRTYERSMYSLIAANAAEGAGTKAQQAVAFDTLVDQLETDYDAFNPDSKDFDQALVDEVIDMQQAFVAKGDTPAQAMAKAVGYIMPEQTKSSAQRNTDTAKNIDAANRQAPNIADAGAPGDAAGDDGNPGNVSGMTDEEFDAMPAATKKRLRGDTFAG